MADSFKKSIIVLQKKSQPSPASSSVHQIEDTSLIQDEKRLMEDEDNTMKEIRCKSNLPIEIHAAMSTETSFHLPGAGHIYIQHGNRFKKQIQLFADKLLQVIGII
nr:uncharacterized protein LOC117688881 isoform X2 [Crassostrea gigas]